MYYMQKQYEIKQGTGPHQTSFDRFWQVSLDMYYLQAQSGFKHNTESSPNKFQYVLTGIPRYVLHAEAV